ncbi:hypothetical protein [Cupriavidus lacunae]|uniref:hypothetical protein n=1 Tax=Cupriavidus lacunae TaxID=2666307 RepID=UPI0010588AB4|nr:hypothetical protein [Cupriavidus lacunae]
MLVFAGCKPGKDGRCNVDVKYRLISPNGLSNDFGTTPVSRRAAPKPGITELGDSVVTVDFNHEDPAGRYVFVATVTDRVANNRSLSAGDGQGQMDIEGGPKALAVKATLNKLGEWFARKG